ncbi:uncharacterized protein LOC128677273 [Plodia interpunctella]|uniref:uncharacterized protein LOC128677273 n=1 Tax=Plodia interpunctella TaxID=58824 RepID=UPI0023678B20|nr:uncharacterized protein LOC128677273 [Plodia interpunctella]
MESIQKSITDLMTLFNNKMADFEENLRQANPSPTLTSLSTDFSTFQQFISTAMGTLQSQVELLMKHQDHLEMSTRRNMLLLHGLPESPNEELVQRIAVMASDSLNLDSFSIADVARCYRIGQNRGGKKPRPILIEFVNICYKDKFWHAKTGLKGTGLTLSEYLTKTRHLVFMAARQHFGITKCWTRDGCIFVIGHNGQKHRVYALEDIDRLREVPTVGESSQAAKPGVASASTPAPQPAAAPAKAAVATATSRVRRVNKK